MHVGEQNIAENGMSAAGLNERSKMQLNGKRGGIQWNGFNRMGCDGKKRG